MIMVESRKCIHHSSTINLDKRSPPRLCISRCHTLEQRTCRSVADPYDSSHHGQDSWTQKSQAKGGSKLCRQTRQFHVRLTEKYSNKRIQIPSMGLVHLPTWMLDFYGKCKVNIPVPWMVWSLFYSWSDVMRASLEKNPPVKRIYPP